MLAEVPSPSRGAVALAQAVLSWAVGVLVLPVLGRPDVGDRN